MLLQRLRKFAKQHFDTIIPMEVQIFYGIVSILLTAVVGLLVSNNKKLNILNVQMAVVENRLLEGQKDFEDHELRLRKIEQGRAVA